MQGANGGRNWSIAVLLYGLGSILASASLGAMLGLAGGLFTILMAVSTAVLAILAAGLALRELGIPRRARPGFARQTRKSWFLVYGRNWAAFLWGLDLGSGLTTIRVFSSFWLLPAGALLVADPVVGSLVYGSYGVGRTLLVASGRFLPRRAATTAFLGNLLRSERRWHVMHATALSVCASLLVLVL